MINWEFSVAIWELIPQRRTVAKSAFFTDLMVCLADTGFSRNKINFRRQRINPFVHQ